MDVRRNTQTYSPPILPQRPKLSIDPSEIRRTEAPVVPSQEAGARGATARGGVAELVETGRTEALSQHESMLARLKQEIENGTYKADWDVVAQRLGEALEAA